MGQSKTEPNGQFQTTHKLNPCQRKRTRSDRKARQRIPPAPKTTTPGHDLTQAGTDLSQTLRDERGLTGSYQAWAICCAAFVTKSTPITPKKCNDWQIKKRYRSHQPVVGNQFLLSKHPNYRSSRPNRGQFHTP